MVRTHCDYKAENLLIKDSKIYLIGFEFGGIDLPVGFDLYCLKRFRGDTDFSDVPYLYQC